MGNNKKKNHIYENSLTQYTITFFSVSQKDSKKKQGEVEVEVLKESLSYRVYTWYIIQTKNKFLEKNITAEIRWKMSGVV